MSNRRSSQLRYKKALRISSFAAFMLYGASSALAQVSVLTANYDNNRTNSNTSETLLNPQSVNRSSFGKVGRRFPTSGGTLSL